MIEYGFDKDHGPRTIGGYAQAAASGFGSGAGLSVVGSKITSAVTSNLPITPQYPANWHPHAVAPNVARWTSVVGETTDRLIGGAGSVASEMLDPDGDRGGELLQDGINGMIDGSIGSTKPKH